MIRNVSRSQSTANYTVVRRNYDPVSLLESDTVNGTVYTYRIYDNGFNTATQPELQDPLGQNFNTVAARRLGHGAYFSTLTRDTVGGLRYIYSENNRNIERIGYAGVNLTGAGGYVDLALRPGLEGFS